MKPKLRRSGDLKTKTLLKNNNWEVEKLYKSVNSFQVCCNKHMYMHMLCFEQVYGSYSYGLSHATKSMFLEISIMHTNNTKNVFFHTSDKIELTTQIIRIQSIYYNRNKEPMVFDSDITFNELLHVWSFNALCIYIL